MQIEKRQILHTDVLIIGGGTAGCYAALTLHSIDLRQVCNELRQKAGLPELEEMQ